jgi:hypothetical protein
VKFLVLYNVIKLPHDDDKGRDVKRKVMVGGNLTNYVLCYVQKLWIVHILIKYFQINLQMVTWMFWITLHKLLS